MRKVRSTYGYDSYRGRSRARTALTVLAVLLAAALVLVVAFFLFAQRYIVYTDDGRAHVELPFFQKAETAPTPPPAATQDIVIVTAAPTAEPTPTPAPERKAVWLLRAALTDGTAQAKMERSGANAVLFNMKADDGTLGYVSALPEAVSYGTSAADPKLNDAIRELTGSEVYTVARVSCFRDDLAPKMNNRLALRSPIGNWRDPEMVRWMSPAVPAARSYVVGICKELAELGFDEILLDNASFPTQGNLDNIVTGERYDPEDLTGAVSDFYAELREALEDYPGVKLTVAAAEEDLTGTGSETSGLKRDILSAYADGLCPADEDYGGFVIQTED